MTAKESMQLEAPSPTVRHYVSFRLGKEIYALDIDHAREIVDVPQLSALPKAPPWIVGLMNLRGRIVPLVDLKKKFDLVMEASHELPYVIIVELTLPDEEGQTLVVGVLADAVLEVFDLADSELGAAPKFGQRFSRSYLRGMVRRDDAMIIVMDAAKVLSDVDEPALEPELEPAPDLDETAA